MKFSSTLLLLIASLAAMPMYLRADMVDGIKVIVHDSIVTYQQVDNETVRFVDDLRRQYRDDRTGFDKKINDLLDENTQKLVDNQLILHEFDTAGYQLPESVIDEYVQQKIHEGFKDRATMAKSLQAEGLTFEKFRKRIREEFIIWQMEHKNVSDAIVISPHKIEMYYVQHTNDFKVTEQVKLRMIVLTNSVEGDTNETRKLGESILTQIGQGASFSEMATIYSQGSQRTQGGEWGWVDKFNTDGAPVLRKELFETAFRLKPGEKSAVIETPEACYIMLVEDHRPEHIKPLNEVRNEIEKRLASEESNRLHKQWMARLRKKTFIRYPVFGVMGR
jgi:peptidyl-prolyl cis-trans isomerase SurA